MLSRTASNLYWLSRNMERAECLARILDATSRLTSLPQAEGETTNEWNSAIATAACMQSFKVNYEEANEQSVTEFLAFSP
ncbi:MAG TPA: alpha-E domain-containing protein, partial [Xanthobacteraceae bacterium]|nr:alpha-E domain-containing protein [Xanthobacteraceae bacterium]